MQFSIYRYDPDKDKKPYMQEYTLALAPGRDMMLLDALEALKAQDQTLSFRRSCREGVCGSDGMNINGKNGLACVTRISSLKSPITLRPLPGFPVVRDLVVDMKPFYRQYEKVQPFIINDKEPPTKERLQSPAEREKLDGLYECILCACCTSSCPSYWWNDKFLGPAALLWMLRFLLDNRDDAKSKRLDELTDLYSLFRCRTIMNCTTVCPKGLNPAKAIGRVRTMLLEQET